MPRKEQHSNYITFVVNFPNGGSLQACYKGSANQLAKQTNKLGKLLKRVPDTKWRTAGAYSKITQHGKLFDTEIKALKYIKKELDSIG
jgi:hypothetical protein